VLCDTVLQAEAHDPVAIYAEGKEHAMAIGLTKLSTADMRAINKGIAVSVRVSSCPPVDNRMAGNVLAKQSTHHVHCLDPGRQPSLLE
jgi:hypothetical protein